MKIFDIGLMFGYPVNTMFPDNTLVDNVDDAELICFGGGSDVNPAVYGHKNIYAYAPDNSRDRFERRVYLACVERNKPMLGICRGSQFLNVMNGGWLVQDMQHPAQHRILYLVDKGAPKQIIVNSTHHQMMIPADNAEIIGWATDSNKMKWKFDPVITSHIERLNVDPEIVFYRKTRSLCVQFHPEYFGAPHAVPELVRYFVKTLLKV